MMRLCGRIRTALARPRRDQPVADAVLRIVAIAVGLRLRAERDQRCRAAFQRAHRRSGPARNPTARPQVRHWLFSKWSAEPQPWHSNSCIVRPRT